MSMTVEYPAALLREALRQSDLDVVHHIAIVVKDVDASVQEYISTYHCHLVVQKGTFALIRFANVYLALVVGHEHPPHFAILRHDATAFGELGKHRDDTWSVYVFDPDGNVIEVLALDPFDVDLLARSTDRPPRAIAFE